MLVFECFMMQVRTTILISIWGYRSLHLAMAKRKARGIFTSTLALMICAEKSFPG